MRRGDGEQSGASEDDGMREEFKVSQTVVISGVGAQSGVMATSQNSERRKPATENGESSFTGVSTVTKATEFDGNAKAPKFLSVMDA